MIYCRVELIIKNGSRYFSPFTSMKLEEKIAKRENELMHRLNFFTNLKNARSANDSKLLNCFEVDYLSLK